MSEKNQPDYIVNVVVGEGEKSRWRGVGVAFVNPKSDTITVYADAWPNGDKLVLTRPKPRQDETPQHKQEFIPQKFPREIEHLITK